MLLAACMAVFLLYRVSLEGGFVLDDKNNIANNPYVQVTSLTAKSLADAASKSVLPTRPIANISFGLNYFFHGYTVKGFHLVNILLHIASGIILFFFIRAFLGLPRVRRRYGPLEWVPLGTAVLWLLHPVETQTVNYIVQRMTLLAALFYILSFFLFIKGRTAASSPRKYLYWLGSLIAALLGLGSKETVAMLPFFLVLFDWYFIRNPQKPLSRKFIFITSLLLVIGVLLAFFYLGKNPLSHIMDSYHGRDFTLAQRLLTQGRVVLFYLGLILLPLPSRLNLEHDFQLSMSLIDPPATLFAIGAIVFLLIIAFAKARRSPLLSFCIVWFFGNLLIESSVIGLEMIFEHRLYLPSMLAILPAIVWLHRILPNRRVQVAVYLAVLSCCMFWTYERNMAWSDTVSLLSDSASKSPNSHRAHLNLGIELKNRNRLDEAISHYHKALQLKPAYAEAYYNLGNAFSIQGKFKEATENYFKALRLTPLDVDTHYNLGYTLAKLWRFDEAVYHYSMAIKLKPDFMEARQELAALKQNIEKLYKKKNTP